MVHHRGRPGVRENYEAPCSSLRQCAWRSAGWSRWRAAPACRRTSSACRRARSRYRRHAPRPRLGAAGRGQPRQDRHPSARQCPRRVRRAGRAGARRRAQPRRAVLHLARRHDRQPALRGAVGRGRARRARAAAARRQQHARARRRPDRRSTRIRTSRCGCSTRSPIAAFASASSSRTSRASTGACTTSRSPRTTRRRSSAGATSATNTSAPTPRWRSATSTSSPSARWCARSRASFDAYWNSESAYPAASLIRAAPMAQRRCAKSGRSSTAARRRRSTSMRCAPPRWCASCWRGSLPLEWAPARVVSDDPSKVLHPPERTDLHMLPRLVGGARRAGAPARPRLAVLRADEGRRRRRCARLPSAACRCAS